MRWPVAEAPIPPLDWELPYDTGVALKRQKTKKKKNLFVKVTETISNSKRINMKM